MVRSARDKCTHLVAANVDELGGEDVHDLQQDVLQKLERFLLGVEHLKEISDNRSQIMLEYCLERTLIYDLTVRGQCESHRNVLGRPQ